MKSIFTLPKLTPQRLVTIAMLLALAFVVDQFKITIIPNQLIIGFGFIVNAITGSITGPIYAFLTGAIEDVLTVLLSSNAANFIPLWTVIGCLPFRIVRFLLLWPRNFLPQEKGLDLCLYRSHSYHRTGFSYPNSTFDSDLFQNSFCGSVCRWSLD